MNALPEPDALPDNAPEIAQDEPANEPERPSLAQSVAWAVEQYFEDLDGEPPENLYALFVDILEKPLLETVVVKARGNQCRAADWLGLNRNTLARKLQQHGLDAKALWFQAKLEQRRRGG